MSDRPPARFILANAAADMTQRQRASLDDLLSLDAEKIDFNIQRLTAMLEQVTDIAQSLEERVHEIAQDAREAEE